MSFETRADRRRFLSGAAAAGFALLAPHTSTPASAGRSVANKLNLAAIGVGNRGADNLIPFRGENMVAVCDVDTRYLERVKERFPEARPYRDFREMLMRDDLDGVIVSCPDHTHAHAVLAALQGGRHVYCEKPLAHNVAEVRILAAAAKRRPLASLMGNHHHAKPGYRLAVAWVRSGALGEVREAHTWTTRPIWPQGVPRPSDRPPTPKELNWDLWLGPALERPYHPAYHPLTWRGWWDFGCGALGDMGPHLLDPLVWALELTAPTRIEAESAAVTEESPPAWSIVRYQFPKRGDLPPLQLTWYDGGKKPPKDATGVERLPANGSLLIGKRGKLFIPAYGAKPVLIPTPGEDPPATPAPFGDVSPGHHQQWLQDCRAERVAGDGFAFGAALTEICLLGNVAVRAGEPIEWDAEQGKITNASRAAKFLQRDYRAGWELPTG